MSEVKKEFKPKPGILYKKQYEDKKTGAARVKLNMTLYLDVLNFPADIPGETKDKQGQRVLRLVALQNDFKKGNANAPDYNIRLSIPQSGTEGVVSGGTTPEYPI